MARPVEWWPHRRRCRNGVALTDPTPLPASGYPIIGVPAGVVLQTGAGLVVWSPDGGTVFVSDWSYGCSDMTIVRYDLATNEFEMSTLPYGGGIGFVVVDRNMMEL